MSSITGAAGPQAAARVAQTITAIAGVATLVFLALSISPIIAAQPHLTAGFDIVSAALVFGIPPTVAVIGMFVSLTVLRRMLGFYCIVFLAVVVAWVPALTSPLPAGVAPWPLEVTALATVPAAIAWRPALVWGYLVLNSVIIAPVRFVSAGSVDWSDPLKYAFFTLTFSAIFTVLAFVAMRNGYALDAATDRARATSARAAAASALAREQARLDALVHDNVMGTLFYASRGGLDESVRRQAAKTLSQLEQLRGGRDQVSDDVACEDFVTRIRSEVLAASPEIGFSVTGTRSAPIPPDVAAAFAEATAEAVRNSLDHAGTSAEPVNRSAMVLVNESRVRVIIRDDGAGFDFRDVAPHRLGILVSIRGRFATIPGGSATVESERGLGTVVSLSWAAP